MKKFALVLSGGGFKGAFQIGALRHLRKNWQVLYPDTPEMKFDIIAGVSVGALNGVLTASGEFDELEKLWIDIGDDPKEIYTSDFIDTSNRTDALSFKIDFNGIREKFLPETKLKISLLKGLQLLFSASGRKRYTDELLRNVQVEFRSNFSKFRSIADNTPLRKRLEALVRIDKIRNCIYKCGFVSLNDGKYYAYRHSDFKSDKDFQSAILASTAMPVVWEPVPTIEVKGKSAPILQSVDGGILNVSPLADVIREINDDDPAHEYTVIIINCNSGEVEYEDYSKANIAGIALRSLNDIAITEIFNNDITEFARINDLIHQVRDKCPDFELHNFNLLEGRTTQILRPFKTIIIQTDSGKLGDPLVANKSLNERRIRHGEEKVEALLQRISSTPEAPRMVIV